MNISEITNLYNITSSDDDKILDYFTECINLNKKPDMLLNESMLYSEYEILFETTSEIIEAQHEINNLTKNIKSEKDYTEKVALLDKLSDSFKKLVNWWYKIDPNKKFKTLHFILNLSTSILLLLFTFKSIKHAGKISAKAALNINLLNGSRKAFNIKCGIIMTIIGLALNGILAFLSKKSEDLYEKINSKDLEKNIAEYDKAIDKINEIIEKTDSEEDIKKLNKIRRNYDQALYQLYKVRESLINKKKIKYNKWR